MKHARGQTRQTLHRLPAADASGHRAHIARSRGRRDDRDFTGVRRKQVGGMVDVRDDAKSDRVRPNGAKVAFRCDVCVMVTLLWSNIGFLDAVC